MNIHTPQLVPRISQQVQDQAPALDMPPTPQQVLKASHWATMARLHAGVDVHDFTTAGKGEVYLRTRAYEQEVMSAALAGTDGPCMLAWAAALQQSVNQNSQKIEQLTRTVKNLSRTIENLSRTAEERGLQKTKTTAVTPGTVPPTAPTIHPATAIHKEIIIDDDSHDETTSASGMSDDDETEDDPQVETARQAKAPNAATAQQTTEAPAPATYSLTSCVQELVKDTTYDIEVQTRTGSSNKARLLTFEYLVIEDATLPEDAVGLGTPILGNPQKSNDTIATPSISLVKKMPQILNDVIQPANTI